jgi:hypothetical protein
MMVIVLWAMTRKPDDEFDINLFNFSTSVPSPDSVVKGKNNQG